jgi:multicomponent Na+:H+ antiporter subunit D
VKLAELGGIGRRMPLTFAAFVIAGLGIIGTPGTAGFISKWYLALGALDRGRWPLVFLIVASSLIALVYIGRVVEVAYFRQTSEAAKKASDPPPNMLVPILVLAVATVYFGFFTELSAGIAAKAAHALIGGLK